MMRTILCGILVSAFVFVGCGGELPAPPSSTTPPVSSPATSKGGVLRKASGVDRVQGRQVSSQRGRLKVLGLPSFQKPTLPHQLPVTESFAKQMGQALVPGGYATSAYRVGQSLYVSGFFKGTIEIQGKEVTSLGEQDGFVSAFDGQGKLKWLRTFGASGTASTVWQVKGGCGRLFIVGAQAGGFLSELSPDSGKTLRTKEMGKGSLSTYQVQVGGTSCQHLVTVSDDFNRNKQGEELVDAWSLEEWGQPKWSWRVSSSRLTGSSIIRMDKAGNIALLASFFRGVQLGKEGSDKWHSYHGYGCLIAWFGVDGSLKWAKPIQTPASSLSPRERDGHAAGLAFDGATLAVAVKGLSQQTIDGQEVSNYSALSLLLFDVSGALKWRKTTAEEVELQGMSLYKGQLSLLAQARRSVSIDKVQLKVMSSEHPLYFVAAFDDKGQCTSAKTLVDPAYGTAVAFEKTDEGFFVVSRFRGEAKAGARSVYGHQEAFWWLLSSAKGAVTHFAASGKGNAPLTVYDTVMDKEGHLISLISYAGKLSLGSKEVDTNGRWRLGVVKRAPNGAVLWLRWFDTVKTEYRNTHKLALGPDGSIWAAGPFHGCVTFAVANRCRPASAQLCTESKSAYLAHWSTSGVFLGARTLPSEGATFDIRQLHVAPNATVFVLYIKSQYKAYLARWSEQMEPLSETQITDEVFGGTDGALATDRNSNVYVGVKGINAFDSSGKLLWRKDLWGGKGSIRDIVVNEKGLVTLSGAVNGGAWVGTNGFVIQLDQKGALKWHRSFAEVPASGLEYRHEAGQVIAQDAVGHTYLYGFHSDGLVLGQYRLPKLPENAWGHFLAKLDAKGEVLWVKPMTMSVKDMFVRDSSLVLVGTKSSAAFSVGDFQLALSGLNVDMHVHLLLKDLSR